MMGFNHFSRIPFVLMFCASCKMNVFGIEGYLRMGKGRIKRGEEGGGLPTTHEEQKEEMPSKQSSRRPMKRREEGGGLPTHY